MYCIVMPRTSLHVVSAPEAGLAHHVGHGHSGFHFLQHRDDLGLGESGLPHVASLIGATESPAYTVNLLGDLTSPPQCSVISHAWRASGGQRHDPRKVHEAPCRSAAASLLGAGSICRPCPKETRDHPCVIARH